MITVRQFLERSLPISLGMSLLCAILACSSSPTSGTQEPPNDTVLPDIGPADTDEPDIADVAEADVAEADVAEADVALPDADTAEPDQTGGDPTDVAESAVIEADIAAHLLNTLGAVVTMTSDTPGTPTVHATAEDHAITIPPTGITGSIPGTSFDAVLLGMYPSTEYTVAITWTTPAGDTTDAAALIWTTPALPDDAPAPEVLVSKPEQMSPGVTLFAVTSINSEASGPPPSDIFMLDSAGAIVGHIRPPFRVSDLRQTFSGTLLAQDSTKGGVEWGLHGEVLHAWTGQELGIETMHHEIFELEDGSLATLGSIAQSVGGYPDNATYDVVGDRVVTFSRAGELLSQFNVFDVLDPYRYGNDFFINYWHKTYSELFEPKDWTHGNGVIHDPSDDTLVVSYRHQDGIFKHNRQTGELIWVLGADLPFTAGDDDWPFLELIGGGTLPSHMHAPQLTPGGTLMLFDNRNDLGQSRTVEYAIDAEAMTAEQIWEYIDPEHDPPLFSRSVSDADLLPGGTVLVTHGANRMGQSPNAVFWALITEVTHDANKTKVFEVRIQSQEPPPLSHRVYRSERIPSLYPCTETPCE